MKKLVISVTLPTEIRGCWRNSSSEPNVTFLLLKKQHGWRFSAYSVHHSRAAFFKVAYTNRLFETRWLQFCNFLKEEELNVTAGNTKTLVCNYIQLWPTWTQTIQCSTMHPPSFTCIFITNKLHVFLVTLVPALIAWCVIWSATHLKSDISKVFKNLQLYYLSHHLSSLYCIRATQYLYFLDLLFSNKIECFILWWKTHTVLRCRLMR